MTRPVIKIFCVIFLMSSLIFSSGHALHISELKQAEIYISLNGKIIFPLNNCSFWDPQGEVLKCYITEDGDYLQITDPNPMLKIMSVPPNSLQYAGRNRATFIGNQYQRIILDLFQEKTKETVNFRSLGTQRALNNHTLSIEFVLGYIFS